MSVGAVNKQTGERIPTAGMPAIDDALDLTSVNPVQNDIITAALALKQNATDNNLDTEAKTIVGAINEHESDIDSLKSGLTNYQAQNDLNLEVPDRKNVLENTANSATVSGVLYTVNNDGSVSVSTETQSSNISSLQINDFTLPAGEYVLNGCPSGGGSNKYELQIAIGGATYRDYGGGVSFTSTNQRCVVQILIRSGVTINDTFYPMIRPATITDPTFAPYIPSLESRIEALEPLLGMAKVHTVATLNGNVISVANSLGNGITFYSTSNSPTNQPQGHEWGSYIIFKHDSLCDIIYIDTTIIAVAYRIDPSTEQSITWKTIALS